MIKDLSDKKAHAALSKKLLSKQNHMNNAFYEDELAKAEIEHKELVLDGFFILHHAKSRML